MFKKLWVRFKEFIKPPELPEINPALEATMDWIEPHGPSEREKKHMNNVENLMVFNLKLQRLTSQHQLRIQHWTMIAALLAVFLSFITSVVAIFLTLYHHTDVVVKLMQAKK